jgi:hypothetical protein
LPGTDTPSNKVIPNDMTRAVAAETATNPANRQALRSGVHRKMGYGPASHRASQPTVTERKNRPSRLIVSLMHTS